MGPEGLEAWPALGSGSSRYWPGWTWELRSLPRHSNTSCHPLQLVEKETTDVKILFLF